METVDLKAYWEKVARFSQYPEDKRADGYALGLMAEAGEVCGVVDKWLRGVYNEDTMKRRLVDELGDLMWYICAVQNEIERHPDADFYTKFDAFMQWVADGYKPEYGLVFLTSRVGVYAGMYQAYGQDNLFKCAVVVVELCILCDTTLQAVLDANVAKLTARHGGPDAQP